MTRKITEQRKHRLSKQPNEMTKDELVREIYSLRKELTEFKSELKRKCAVIENLRNVDNDEIARKVVNLLSQRMVLRR